MSLEAFSPACLIWSNVAQWGCSTGSERSTSSLYPLITVRRLLKSWAMPPASCPIASIFWDWRNCASRLLRSVMSVAIAQIAYTFPSVSRSGNLETMRSEEHTSELQSRPHLVCRLLLEKKKKEEIHDLLRIYGQRLRVVVHYYDRRSK